MGADLGNSLRMARPRAKRLQIGRFVRLEREDWYVVRPSPDHRHSWSVLVGGRWIDPVPETHLEFREE